MPAARPESDAAAVPVATAPATAATAAAARPLPRTDLLLLAVSVGAISLSAPLISATAAPALAIAFWRNLMSVGVLGPYALLRHRAELRAVPGARCCWRWRPGCCSPSTSDSGCPACG